MHRLRDVKIDPTLYAVCILACFLLHFHWNLTDRLSLSLYPLAFLVILYIGYKFGGVAALVAGGSCWLLWLVTKIFWTEQRGIYDYLIESRIYGVFDNRALSANGQGLEDFIILSGFGFLSAKGFDWLEARLLTADLTLESLFPPSQNYIIQTFATYIGRVFTPARNEDKQEEQVETSTTVEVSGLKPKFDFKIVFKSAGAFLVFALFVVSSIEISFRFRLGNGSDFYLRVLPYYSSVMLFLLFAYFQGFYRTLGALLLIAVPFSIYVTVILGYGVFDDLGGLSVDPAFSSVAILIFTIIASWWLVNLGRIWRTESVAEKLRGLFSGAGNPTAIDRSMTTGAFLLIVVLSVSIGFHHYLDQPAGSTTGVLILNRSNLSVTYNPPLFIFALLVYFSRHYRPQSISNHVFCLLLILGLQYSKHLVSFHGASLGLYDFDAIQIVLLSLSPMLFAHLRPRSLKDFRVCCFGFFAVLASFYLLAGGSLFGATSLHVRLLKGADQIIMLLLQVLVCELLARWLAWSYRRQEGQELHSNV